MDATQHTRSPYPICGELEIHYGKNPIFNIPDFLLLNLILMNHKGAEKDDEYQELHSWADRSFGWPLIHEEACLTYLKTKICWETIDPFIDTTADTRDAIRRLWLQRDSHALEVVYPDGSRGQYSMHLKPKEPPKKLYRYIRFDIERSKEIFKENKLFFPSPGRFNDPFDCGLEEKFRLEFIGSAMLCFCEANNNVLLYSHYADSHYGVCLIFDPGRLAESVERRNQVGASIRPIWYVNKLPPIDFKKKPALGCTIKASSWAYEKEWRLFMDRDGTLLQEGHYLFEPGALTGVIFGCRAEDKTILEIKKMTAGRENLSFFKAKRVPNQFDLAIEEIPKL